MIATKFYLHGKPGKQFAKRRTDFKISALYSASKSCALLLNFKFHRVNAKSVYTRTTQANLLNFTAYAH
ncbi:hypothetical protein [uncultured Campylobacter sp.]|uniref:hypothetical protein n=1 Tax=uncultured Campylobacter sp. TaxID=218934 RepID=UPI00260452AC|nr:hypothetical protein [uncultured Campylobacter sp.]